MNLTQGSWAFPTAKPNGYDFRSEGIETNCKD